ncbi:PKD domain-containing protein [Geofilum sp. OHC36d9]|uniref:PKD domain-containing protein n=1 Tax=Geofilum sp. OHC36d9 TaxID=3458413 RepID=UPI004033337B
MSLKLTWDDTAEDVNFHSFIMKKQLRFLKGVMLVAMWVVAMSHVYGKSDDIHNYVCKGGTRTITASPSASQYRWHIINVTTSAETVVTNTDKEYNFTMPDANDAYRVYFESPIGSGWSTSNSVYMYPYDFPDAFINPAGTFEFTSSATLNGDISSSLPASGGIDALDLEYEWLYEGVSVEIGNGSTDSYTTSDGGQYIYRVQDKNSRVTGCISASPTTLLVENVSFTLDVCEDGFTTGETLLDMASIAAADRASGSWTETAGLDFSDYGTNPMITGFVSGNAYSVKWSRDASKIYTFILNTGAGMPYELQNESGTTSDVILCLTSHTFTVSPAGAAYSFMVDNVTAGTTTQLTSESGSNVYAFTPADANAIYEIYAVVKDGNCRFKTNAISISSDEEVEIRVVGDESVCDGDFDKTLEAVPFDSNYAYSWEKDGTAIGGETGQTMNTSSYGAGSYTVSVVGCGGSTYTSDPVVVASYTLPDAKIDPEGAVQLCHNETENVRGYISTTHSEPLSYTWLKDGAEGLAAGVLLSDESLLAIDEAGTYEFKIYETANPLCYSVSPTLTLSETNIEIQSFIANGSTTFCGSQNASVALMGLLEGATGPITVTIQNVEDGTEYTVLLNSGVLQNVSLGTISSTKTYKIKSVSAAGCSLSAAEIAALPTIKYVKEADPAVYDVTGGPYCKEGAIGLSGSEAGIYYYLLRDGIFVSGVQVAGDGNPITFGTQNDAGVYTVMAEQSGCEEYFDMNGTAVIYAEPDVSLDVVLTGTGCAGSTHSVTVQNTESDVYYTLYRENEGVSTAASAARKGNGGDLVFTGIVQSGTYSLMAKRGTCEYELTQTVFIAPRPALQTLTETVGCEGIDFYVELQDSETGVEYALSSNSTGVVIETIVGTDGTSITFTSPITTAGEYTVTAENGYGCKREIGTVELLPQPIDTYVLITTGTPVCSGTPHTISLSGSELGLTYRLYRNNTTGGALSTVYSTTGGSISFGTYSDAGTYIVTADNGGCEIQLSTELIMYQQPVVYNVVDADYCENDDVTIELSNFQIGVTYTLLRGGTDYGMSQAGSTTSSSITFGPEKFPPGTYSIRGSAGGCLATMSGDVTVNSNPTISISGLSDSYCADAGDVTVHGSPASNSNGSWSVVGYSPLPNHFGDDGAGGLTFNVTDVVSDYGSRPFELTYSYVDPNGCEASLQRSTEFFADLGDIIRFRNLPALTCQSAGTTFTLQAYFDETVDVDITTGDGLFFGPGITDNGDGTATFDPLVAGNGLHTITYNYTDPVTTCSGSYSAQVQVGTSLSINGVNPVFCVDDGPQDFWGEPATGSPVSGMLSIYSWDGTDETTKSLVTQKLGTTAADPLVFNPTTEGFYFVEYSFTDGSGCVNSDTEEFEVSEEIDASFIAYVSDPAKATLQFCVDAGLVTLAPATGASPNGNYYCSATPSVIKGGNKFDPKEAGVGTHRIYRDVSTLNCHDIQYIDIEVYETLVEVVLPRYEYCINDATGPFVVETSNLSFDGTAYQGVAGAEYTFSALSPSPLYTVDGSGNRTYHSSHTVKDGDEPLYFDPAKIRPDAKADFTTTINLLYDNTATEGGCFIDIESQDITIKIAPDVTFGTSDPMLFCQDDAARELVGAFESGGFTGDGNFTGSGIIDATLNDGLASFDPSLVAPGSHLITYTFTNSNGCVSERTKTFEVNESPVVYNVTPKSSVPNAGRYCYGEAGVVIGLEYSQNGVDYHLIKDGDVAHPIETVAGKTDGTSISFSPVKVEGTYTIEAELTASSGCTSMMNGSVEVQINKVVASVDVTNVSCFSGNDGVVAVTASGGSLNYVYKISSDGGTTFTESASNLFPGLKAGTYHVQVEDAVGCELPAAVEVVVDQSDEALTLTTSSVPAGGCVGCTEGVDCEGAASVVVKGGTPFDTAVEPTGYKIVWEDGAGNVLVAVNNGLGITKMPAGDYTVTVTDANGCVEYETVTIGTVTDITLTEDLTKHKNVDCYGASTGQFVVTAADGDAAAVYQFSLDGVNWLGADDPATSPDTKTFIGRPAGSYMVYVRDANYPRCTYQMASSVVITQPTELSVAEVISSHKDVSCYGGADASFEVKATGGATTASIGYTYDVNGSGYLVDAIHSGLTAGIYNVQAKDANGCIASGLIVEIKENTKLSLVLDDKQNVFCHSDDNGSITVLAAGGDGNYVYSLNDGSVSTAYQSSEIFENLIAGTYSVKVKDGNECESTLTNITITEPKVLTVSEVSAKHKNVSCFGDSDGSITVTATGGSGDYDFSKDNVIWETPGTDSYTFSNLNPGSYTIWVRDANETGCYESSTSIEITQPDDALTVALDKVTDVTCAGGTDGSIEISADGGTKAYDYRWFEVLSSGVEVPTTHITDNPTGLAAGNYKVQVTDDHLCVATATYVVDEPADKPVISVDNIVNVTEPDGNDGRIEISVSGGTTPYAKLEWSGTEMDGTAVTTLTDDVYSQANLEAGKYSVKVTDATGCSVTYDNIVVSEPNTNLNISVSKKNPGPCYGATNGSIGLSAYGGNQPYKSITLTRSGTEIAKLTSGNSFANYDNLVAGTYVAKVVDNTDVEYSTTIVLTQPDELVLSFSKLSDVTCNGADDGRIQFRAEGGTPFPGDAMDPLLPDNDYYIVSLIPATGSARTVYIEEGATADEEVTDLFADSGWEIFVQDANGCDDSELFEITEPDPIVVTGAVTNNISCNGADDGKIVFTVTGGRNAVTPYTYDWYYEDGTLLAADAGASGSGLAPGGYYVEVKEFAAPNCPAVSTIYDIIEPSALTVSVDAFDVNTCKGDNSGRIEVVVNGGVSPYRVDYGTGVVSGNGPVFEIPDLLAGAYNITVTDDDGAGCIESGTATINEPVATLTLTDLVTSIDCETVNTGKVSFKLEGGVPNSGGEFAYRAVLLNTTNSSSWAKESLSSSQPVALDFDGYPLPAGDYKLTITDRNASASASCAAIVETFSLSHINVTSTVADATCAGVNTGEIKDITITGGSGDYSWTWSTTDGLGYNNSVLNQTGLSAGTYNLALTDNTRSCTVNTSYDVDYSYDLQISASVKAVSCADAADGRINNVVVTGISDPTSVIYHWQGPDVDKTMAGSDVDLDPNLSNLEGGTYMLTVTDGSGCSVIESFTVNVPQPITYDLSTDLDNCNYSRSITLDNVAGGTGTRVYVWNGPDGFTQAAQSITGITVPGIYSVTAIDDNNCQATQSITVPGEMTLSATTNHVKCYGDNTGSIVLDVEGGTGNYKYAWTQTDGGSGVAASDRNQNDLTAGTYTVEVTDEGQSCGAGSYHTETLKVVITQPEELSVTGEVTDVLCAGDEDGKIILSPVGGSGSYYYSWSSANGTGLIAGQRNQTGLSGGEYSVVLTDAVNKCNAVANFTVEEPEALDFDLTVVDTDCADQNSITINNPSGGSEAVANYKYSWAGPGIAVADASSQTDLPGGVYTIRMSDTGISELCYVEKEVTLTKTLEASAVTTPETCPGSQDGTIVLTVNEGVAPYFYQWTDADGNALPNASNRNQSSLGAGTYKVTITDSRSGACTFDLEVVVGLAHDIELHGSVTDVKCYGDDSGAIDLTVLNGSGDYDFEWTSVGFKETTEDISGLSAGSYNVEVNDNVYGCSVNTVYTIKQPTSAIGLTSAVTDVKCKGSATGAIDISVTGGTGTPDKFTFQWSSASGGNPVSSVMDQKGLLAADYSVRVIDSVGCVADFGPFTVSEPAKALQVSLVEVIHVTVNGGTNGAIEVDATGGFGNYSYDWVLVTTDGLGNEVTTAVAGSTNRQEGLEAGVYRVTVTDDNGCTESLQQIVNEPGGILTIHTTTKNIRPCSDNANGELLVQVTGGTPDMTNGTPEYDILVTRGGTVIADEHDVSVNLTGLAAGTYHIAVVDANSVLVDKDLDITAFDPLVVDVDIDNHVTCYQGNDASITLMVSGGEPNTANKYRVYLLGADVDDSRETTGTETFSGLSAGTYIIRVWDDADGDGSFANADPVEDDCFYTETLTIEQPEAVASLSLVAGSEDLCIGSKPQLQIIVTDWDVVSDPLTVTLNDNTVLTVDESPIIFEPDDAPPIGVFEYEITSVEISSCAKGYGQGTAGVIVHSLPTAHMMGDNRICLADSALVSVDLTGTAPWSITYSDGTQTTTVDDILTSPYQFKVAPDATTKYELPWVSDAYCFNTGTGSAEIEVDDVTEIALVADDSPEICNGDSFDLFFEFSPNTDGPWFVVWTEKTSSGTQTFSRLISATDLLPAPDDNRYKLTVLPKVTTTYAIADIQVRNGGDNYCDGNVVDQEVTVTVNQLPQQPASISGKTVICQGTEAEYSISSVSDATSYEWQLPKNVTLLSGGGTNKISVLFTETAESGYLRVRGLNICGEGAFRQVYISVNEYPETIGEITGPTAVCQGTPEISFSVDPVDDATQYFWTVPDGWSFTGQNSTGIWVTIDPNIDNFTGQVTVTPVNDCGNSLVTKSHEFTIYPLPTADAGLDGDVCGTSYTLTAQDPDAGSSGVWSLVEDKGYGEITDPTNPKTEVTNLSRGDVTFRWTVTNSNIGGTCEVYDTVTIRNNQLAVYAVPGASSICDGVVDVTGTPVPALSGTVGVWSVVAPAGSKAVIDDASLNSTTISNLEPGENRFRWSIIQNGCESYAEVTVMNNEPDEAVIDGDEVIDICVDEIDLTANTPLEGTGEWSVVKGYGHISDVSASDISVTDLSRGDNIFRYTITKGSCYTYDEVMVRNNQLDVDAGKDQTVCDASAMLEGSTLPVDTEGAWEVAKGVGHFTNGTLPDASVDGLAVDENKLVWKVLKRGCVSTDTVVIVNNQPTVATVGSVQTKCGFETLLTGNKAIEGNGRWSIVTGSGDFEDITDPTTKVTNLGLGKNSFRWTIRKGACSTSADLVVYNNRVEVDAGKDFSSCSRLVTMSGSAVPLYGMGQWNVLAGVGGGTITSSERTKPNAQISGLDYGVNGFIWTIDNGGCISSDTVYVNNSTPYPVEAGMDQTINGTAATLDAEFVTYGEGTWSLVSGGGTIATSDIHNPQATITDLRRGENVFRWTVSNGDCFDYDDVMITNGEVTEADAGPDQKVCDATARLEGNDPDVALGQWSVVLGAATFENINDPETRVYNLAAGENTLRWTISYSSSSSFDDVIITNNQPDQARAGYDDAICADNVQLKGNKPGFNLGTGVWELLSGGGTIEDVSLPNPKVTDLMHGENLFVYTISKDDCASSDTVSIINGLPTTANAGDDGVTCDGTMRLLPNSPTYGSASWRTGGEGSARFEGNWVYDLAQGDNELIYVIETDYCTSTDTLVVTNNKPTGSNAGRLQDICEDEVTMTASQVYYGVGTWEQLTGSGVIADIHDPSTLITGLAKGENRFKWLVDNNGCTSSSEVIINNNFVEALAGDMQINCADTAMLQANNPSPGIGSWGVQGGSGSANFEDATDPYTLVSNLDQGSNILTWTVEYKGCVDVSTVEVINNNPTVADAGYDIPSCDPDVILTANTPTVGDGTWTIVDGGGDFTSPNGFADAINDPGARIENLKFGRNILRWTIRNKSCVSSDDVVVEYNTIQASAGDDRVVCADEVILQGNNPFPGSGNWSIPGGEGTAVFTEPSQPGTTVNNLQKGSNTLRWTIGYKGCVTSDDVVITNDLPSTAYAGNKQTLCDDATILDATKPAVGTGRWTVVTGAAVFADETLNNTSVSALAKGDNIFVWTTKNNKCTLEDQVVIVNNKPSEPYAGASYEEVCSSDFTLKAATPDFGTGTWSIILGGGTLEEPTNPRSDITNLDYGTNTLRWTVSQGNCSLYSEVTIENNTPTTANAGPDIQDCKDIHVLDANIPVEGNGTWSRISGYGDFNDASNAKATVSNLAFGENVFEWTITKGNCFSSDQVVIFNKIPDKAFAGTDQTGLCDTYTVLNANDPVSGEGRWSVIKGQGTFDNETSFNSKVSEIGFGENIYRWEVAYGECSTTDEVVVISNKAEAYAGEDQVVYEPSATLNANNAGELDALWTIVGTSTAQLADASFFNTSVSTLSEGINTFKWRIDVNGCVTSDLVSVDYRPIPDAGFITDVESGCYPLAVQFTNYSVGGSVYNWDFGDGNTSGDRNPKHTFNEPGVFNVKLVAPGPDGNDGVFTKSIEVYDHPIADFTVNPQLVYVPGDKARFYDLSSDAVSWNWRFGDGEVSEERNPSYEYQEEGVYSVQLVVSNQYGCLDTLLMTDIITAEPQGFVEFPNAFKPRPGGSSESVDPSSEYVVVFKPAFRDIDTFTMEIFNRWGQKVFQTNDMENGWDGMYEGQLAPQGVYVYKVSGRYLNGREYRKTGSVLLVR